MTAQEIWNAFQAELAHAEHLYPVWPTIGHKGDHVWAAAILAEETGEVMKTALNWQAHGRGDPEHLRSEAIQVGAMALRFLLNLDTIEQQRINEETRQELQKEHNIYPQGQERIILAGEQSAAYITTDVEVTKSQLNLNEWDWWNEEPIYSVRKYQKSSGVE